jgi:hypothetical protein
VSTERSDARPPFPSEAWWLAEFECFDVQYLVLDPDEDRRLIRYVRTQPRWRLDFSGPGGVLYVRGDVVGRRDVVWVSRASRLAKDSPPVL